MNTPMPRAVACPILPSRDLAATSDFYVRQLGFAPTARHPEYAIFHRGAMELHFFRFETLDPAANYAGCYIRAADLDALYREWSTKVLPKLFALETKPWGLREFALLDPDTNLLRVGEFSNEMRSAWAVA